ncbi:MAG: GH3 auxin-responsive promoter family protein [Candidatus Bathyarchaeota archaeon]|nr:MAG: GH3 auxin-responsive promoter family protein [Candidatus Bathyarchaeota archaeon]
MSNPDLWKKYCSFYDKSFQEQVEYNNERLETYFSKWKKTDIAKKLDESCLKNFKDIPITDYSNYPMLHSFASELESATKNNSRAETEPLSEYYHRISSKLGASLNRYMTEPYYFCATTTGSTGKSKIIANGETFWKNFFQASLATVLVSCSDSWGETKLKQGDTALNINAPVPYISGWGADAFKHHFNMIPPIEVADNLQNMKEKFTYVLKAIEKGKKIDVAGGIGSMFYMICKYIVDPEELFSEYYRGMSFGLKKTLLAVKLFQLKISGKTKKQISDFLPLKGIIVGGMDSQLYIDFFKNEFNFEPLHAYGATEAGNLMRGDPDRKTDLVPNMIPCFLEFQTDKGEMKNIEEVKKGETYNLVITPFGSIVFRYDMGDLFRVVDFRDDGMPVFSFEGRKTSVIDVLGYYRLTSRAIVDALFAAGLRTSDKWAVAKLVEPKEKLCFLMEKTWSYTEKEAEKRIFEALQKTQNDFKKYVTDFNIKEPSEAVKVEYIKHGAFLRYSALKGKMGAPLGQYKPPQLIPPDRMEIYETLRSI